jgi:hypothetical protein
MINAVRGKEQPNSKSAKDDGAADPDESED